MRFLHRAWPLLFIAGCDFPKESACTRSSECRDDRVCVRGACLETSGDAGPVETVRVCEEHLPVADGCLGCAAQACCAEIAACRADADCAPVLDCLGGCDVRSDALCREACFGLAPPTAGHPVGALWQCAANACSDECGGCGALGLGTSATCVECAVGSPLLCDAAAKCMSSGACVDPIACLYTCADPKACRTRCGSPLDPLNPETVVLGAAAAACSSACGFGHDFSCVGAYDWGGPSRAVVRTAIRVRWLTRDGRARLEGAEVRMCNARDRTCDRPIETLVTDRGGEVVFEAGAETAGTDVYFEVRYSEGELDVVPLMIFFAPPPLVIEESWSLAMVTRPEWEALAGSVERGWSPEDSLVTALPLDCTLSLAPGIQMTLDPPNADPVYVEGASFNLAATATDERAISMFTGTLVPAGQPDATYRVKASRDGVELGARQFMVRPGWMTTTFLAPAERR